MAQRMVDSFHFLDARLHRVLLNGEHVSLEI